MIRDCQKKKSAMPRLSAIVRAQQRAVKVAEGNGLEGAARESAEIFKFLSL
jgi:hypothetical protein